MPAQLRTTEADEVKAALLKMGLIEPTCQPGEYKTPEIRDGVHIVCQDRECGAYDVRSYEGFAITWEVKVRSAPIRVLLNVVAEALAGS